MEDSDLEPQQQDSGARDQNKSTKQKAFDYNFNDGNQNDGGNDEQELNEELELEIPNDQEITNDYVTVMAVSNFLNLPENEELAKNYDYTVEYLELDEQEEGQHNFIAKFKLKMLVSDENGEENQRQEES